MKETVTIYYWADGCWVDTYDDLVDAITYKSDDYGTIEVSVELDEIAIDALVFDLIA
jgi:hypothetical protein